MKDLKFRAYDTRNKKYIKKPLYAHSFTMFGDDGTLAGVSFDWDGSEDPKDFIIEQFIGLKDKKGRDIYEGSYIRVRHEVGIIEGSFCDCLYRINKLTFNGVSASFIQLTNVNPKTIKNSFPINNTLSFEHNSLTTDYRNNHYDKIAINDTSGQNSSYGTTWKENIYSNDITIVTNPKIR